MKLSGYILCIVLYSEIVFVMYAFLKAVTNGNDLILVLISMVVIYLSGNWATKKVTK